MRWLFWGAVGVIAYAYLGYVAWLYLRGFWRPWPVRRAPFFPFISIVMAVRNEEHLLHQKLSNLLQIDYPVELLEIVVASDGSGDRTEQILREHTSSGRVRVIANSVPRGKAACLNDAMQIARGELIVFTDARQLIEPNAIRLLAENFADQEVGCVSGQLMLGNVSDGESAKGLGLYWKIEKQIRTLESNSGSVVGATGALYAVRKSNIVAIPAGTILDDVYLPMHVVKQGKRSMFDSRARAWDDPDLGKGHEFARKVRTLTGNYQLLQLAPWLLSSRNPIRFEFISHKLTRLLVPFALIATLLSPLVLHGPVYSFALFLQLALYAFSLLSMLRVRGPLARAADGAFTFVMLNAAALVAFGNFVFSRKAAWSR
ncbi:MAG TPA: glycosyltransferase family 2 protein [Terriglobales bacterium]|jgi:cellulose synthase/poly-beta-1,6-N-acetylglucosamine synthase-like glycosyltransferase